VDNDVGQVAVHFVEHGTGRPVLVLHGAGVDHREAEACFEPVLERVADLRRIYPDLPGMGRTVAPDSLRSADDVLETLLGFADEVTGGTPYLLLGHSAGAYYAEAMAGRRPGQVAGLALLCPLSSDVREVPKHRVVCGSGELGDDAFRSYFVIQTPEMLQRYERHVAPGAALSTTRPSTGSANGGPSLPMRRPPTRVRHWSWPGGWTPRSGTPQPSISPRTTPVPR
jgi:pimeloyl-ACP methyl ester carboxylesterase